MGLRSALGVGGSEGFDGYDEFVPDHLPAPGEFLEDADVLTGREHAAVHRLASRLFERRGVYDMTFGYNLARLNLDRRHPTAGFRYAEDGAELRAEFTPTTEFCPQSDTLTVGTFRAFNGERDAHGYDLVRVRVDRTHHEAISINGRLRQLETQFEETGTVPRAGTGTAESGRQTGGVVDGGCDTSPDGGDGGDDGTPGTPF